MSQQPINNNITPMRAYLPQSSVPGMTQWEVNNVQRHIQEHRAERELLRLEQLDEPKVIEEARQPTRIMPRTYDRAAFMANVQAIADRARRRDPRADADVVPLAAAEPIEVHNGFICPRCQMTVNRTNTHGYLRSREVSRVNLVSTMIDCPMCTPPVKAYQTKVFRRKYLARLVEDGIFENEANYPEEALFWSLESLEYLDRVDPVLIRAGRDFADGKHKELLVDGETGRAKTGMAVAVLKKFEAEGYLVLHITMQQYLELLRDDYDKSKQKEPTSQIRTIVRAVDVLLIDDLACDGIGKAFEIRETQSLLEARHAKGQRTIITSNLSLPKLERFWQMDETRYTHTYQPAKRVISRLEGWYQKIHVQGADQRTGKM